MSEQIAIERAMPLTGLERQGDGWTLYGLAVPYGKPQRVTDDGKSYYLEEFVPGAFRDNVVAAGRGVRFLLGHDRDITRSLLGHCVELAEQEDGLYAGFRLYRDHPYAEQARSGELTKWSISALIKASVTRQDGGRQIVQRTYCALDHVAATARPQYAEAGMREARAQDTVPVTPLAEKLRVENRARREERDRIIAAMDAVRGKG